MKLDLHNSSWRDAPDPAQASGEVTAKALWAEDHDFLGTVPEAIDLLIDSDYRNDAEIGELFVSQVKPDFG